MSIKTIYNKIKNLDRLNYLSTRELTDREILEFVRKNKGIIYGAKAMNAQGEFPYQRATEDYDVFIENPKLSSEQLDKLLDKVRKGNYHYVKKSQHKGTYKVRDIGYDLIKETDDDVNLADFTKKPNKLATKRINGINYANLVELEKRKARTLKFKKYKFRYGKDREDLKIIRKLKGGLFWV